MAHRRLVCVLASTIAVALLVLTVVVAVPAFSESEPAAPPPKPIAYSGPTTDERALIARAVLAERVEAAGRWYTWAAAHPPVIVVRRRSSSAPTSGGSHRGYATARECVSMTEHGGSYDESTNPTHKGRYQFSRSAWISFGGDPAHWDDWSLASPAEQDAVFATAWDQGPAVQQQQWLRWDGC